MTPPPAPLHTADVPTENKLGGQYIAGIETLVKLKKVGGPQLRRACTPWPANPHLRRHLPQLKMAILKPWAILGWFGWISIHQETEANHTTQEMIKPSKAKTSVGSTG